METLSNEKHSVPANFLRGFSGQDDARHFLWQAHISGRIASAYLFAGPAGVGKFLAALEFIKFLKCPNRSDGTPCNECQSCRTIDLWDNPDIFIIFPMPKSVWESDSRSKSYDDFRKTPHLRPRFGKLSTILLSMILEVQRFFATSATSDGGKFVLVPDAHKMNKQSANAFLKTLEEPPEDAHIILSTDRAEALLPTIRSRAQMVRFRRLSTQDVVRQLVDNYSFPPERADTVASIAEGSIARALMMSSEEFQQFRNDALSLMKNAAENNITAVWEWTTSARGQLDYAKSFVAALLSIARDVAVAASADGAMLNSDIAEEIFAIAKKIDSKFDALDMLKNLSALQMDLDRNPQYSLFYGAVATAIIKSFAK